MLSSFARRHACRQQYNTGGEVDVSALPDFLRE
jgi:hypothetical protein